VSASVRRRVVWIVMLVLLDALMLAMLALRLHAEEPPASEEPPPEVAAEEPSPWVGAFWCPVDTKDRSAEPTEKRVRCDVGVGVALYHWDHPVLWRLAPAVGVGTVTAGAGMAWVVTARDAEKPVAVFVGLALPRDDVSLKWDRREFVVGITRSVSFGGGKE